MLSPATPQMRGLAFAAPVATMALWGSNGAVAKMILPTFGAIPMTWLRWYMVMVLAAPIAWRERAAVAGVVRRHWRMLVLFKPLGGVPQSVVVFIGPDDSGAAQVNGLPHPDAAAIAGLHYMSAVPTIVSTLTYTFAVGHMGPAQAGVFIHLSPLFACLLAALLAGETLHPCHAAGLLLPAGGAWISCHRATPVLSSAPAKQPRRPFFPQVNPSTHPNRENHHG